MGRSLQEGAIFRLVFRISLIAVLYASAQKSDSSSLHLRIKKFSQQHRFTSWAYRLIFTDGIRSFPQKFCRDEMVCDGSEFQCKIIRSVSVHVLDPYELNKDIDTISEDYRTRKFKNGINNLHLTTRKWVIRNQLLFHPLEEFETLLALESERLLRQLEYVQDAKITVHKAENNDSVDIKVLVWDRWSLIAPITFNHIKNVGASIIEKNLLGTGQRFEQRITTYDFSRFGYSVAYDISNLDHSFIRARIYFNSDTNQSDYGVAFNRALFSPVITWAGGAVISAKTISLADSFTGLNNRIILIQNDWWLAKNTAIHFFRGRQNRTTNFVSGFRFTNLDVRQESNSGTPSVPKLSSYLLTVGISHQEFYKTKFLYRFGTNEDIPLGFRFQLLFGKLYNSAEESKNYFGFQSALAYHFRKFYCSLQVTEAKYSNKINPLEHIRQLNLFCFSEPLKFRKWGIRWFVFFKGENLKPGVTGRTLQVESVDLYGNSGSNAKGNYKLIMNLELVGYAPFQWVGFKFGYMLMWGCGKISDTIKKMKEQATLLSFVTGFLFRNEQLLNSTFQFSVGYFPLTPDGEVNVFRLNPVSTFTLRFNVFSISKPSFIF